MSPTKRYAKKQAKTRQRRRHTAHERLRHDQQQAQQAIKALEQALDALGLPDNLVKEIEGRLRRQQKLLGKIFGVMFPSLFGCRTPSELARVRGWDKNLPPQILGGSAQAFLVEAAQTAGSGGVGATVAPCPEQECGHSQSLAVDLGS